MAATTFNNPLDIWYASQLVVGERFPIQDGSDTQIAVLEHTPVVRGTVRGKLFQGEELIQTFFVAREAGSPADFLVDNREGVFLTEVSQEDDSRIRLKFNKPPVGVNVVFDYEYDVNGPLADPQADGRDLVWEAVQSEREYQVRRWGHRQDDGSFIEAPHSVCEFLVYMKNYLDKAFVAASEKAGDEAALDVLRKVVTLGVACFEQHGIEPRDLSNIVNVRDGQPA